MYPGSAGGRVGERDHVAHVERHDVVELDALVQGGGAQPLPVPRHLRRGIGNNRKARRRNGRMFHISRQIRSPFMRFVSNSRQIPVLLVHDLHGLDHVLRG